MATNLPVPEPAVNVDAAPYWDAAVEGRLVIPVCDDCGSAIWYPRPFCPECSSWNVTWTPDSGLGQIYSFTVCRRGVGEYKELDSYVFGYVDLDVGVRVMTNIVDCDYDALEIGDRVRAVFHPTPEGSALLRFRPA